MGSMVAEVSRTRVAEKAGTWVVLVVAALAGAILAAGLPYTAAAQQQQPDSSNQKDALADPSAASLTVGSMSIAANAALGVEAMAIDVGVDKVAYTYKLANKGATPLSLQASVALPDLETSDDNVYYMLPATDPENIVGLEVAAKGSPVPTKPAVQALALGLDQLAELKAANIPLIPFSEDTGKALAAAKPETLARLDSLGLVAPHDPGRKDAAIEADWSLRVVRGWMQTLSPSTVTDVGVTFAPVKAVYTIDASSLSGLDSLVDQVCVTPQVGDAVTAMLREKGSTASVADITIATDGPARFVQNPRAAITVHKPSPKAVVVFCGMDAASQTAELVHGARPETADSTDVRILIFDKDK
jgi:hypothetical protein